MKDLFQLFPRNVTLSSSPAEPFLPQASHALEKFGQASKVRVHSVVGVVPGEHFPQSLVLLVEIFVPVFPAQLFHSHETSSQPTRHGFHLHAELSF